MIKYKNNPSNLSSQPSIANWNVFFISLAPNPTKKTTKINTRKKESRGIHFVASMPFCCSHDATSAESLSAAANPIINDIKEKIPTTNPLLTPLKAASIIMNTKAMSMII